MRRILPMFAAVPLLVLGLAACGGDDSEDMASNQPETSTPAEATTEDTADTTNTESDSEEPADAADAADASDDATTDGSNESSTEDSSTDLNDDATEDGAPSDRASSGADWDEPSAGASEDASGGPSSGAGNGGGGAGTRTTIGTLWVDDAWSVEDVDEDLCEMGGKTRSPYAQDDDMFVCGPTAAGAEACDITEGTEVLCIADPVDHRAIRFDSPTALEGDMDQGDGDLIPLFVLLDDASEEGIQCSTVAHDQDRHWHQKFSWYRCADGSELLTDELIEETFDRGDDGTTWTGQRSIDKGAPEEIAVQDAVFAGN